VPLQNEDSNTVKNDGSVWARWTPISTVLTAMIILFLIVVAVRLASGQLTISPHGLRFTDLLTLLIALFSIWLSVSFFHQANNSNNLFYDNTYKFTQDVSVLLGRIEAGFGERLRSLDEGYLGIRQSVDTMRDRVRHAEDEIIEQEGAVITTESDRDAFLKEIVAATTFGEKQKNELLRQLRDKDEQVAMASQRLVELEQSLKILSASTSKPESVVSRPVSRRERVERVERILLRRLKSRDVTLDAAKASDDELVSLFHEHMRPMMGSALAMDLAILGFVDREQNLSPHGIFMVRSLLAERNGITAPAAAAARAQKVIDSPEP
jgi:hypothetical protein